jgi:molybdopterin molybdotransferase
MLNQVSCQDDYDPNSLSSAEALERIYADLRPVTVSEPVALRSALGRVLAEPVHSRINVPSHTNSAMDGYAVRGADLPGSGTARLKVIGSSFAGHPFSGTVQGGQAVRIMTGAVVPAGSDTVIIQEQAEAHGDDIEIGAGHVAGQNVRNAGEDIAQGELVLAPGRRLNPADLGLLASLGITEVRVYRRLRVAFFSTGDELRSLGEDLAPGEIYDSNRYTLYGMLTQLSADIIDMGVVRDEPELVNSAFTDAARCADVVITSGGVSVGEADYIKETLAAVGQVSFWKVAMKPGRPLAYGRIGNATFFGLPGNPVSVMVTFYQFVQPALRRLMGENPEHMLTIRARTASRLKKRPGRTEYQRGILDCDDNGELVVRKTGAQGSGILSSMSQANCFIVLPMDQANVEPGQMVEVQPFFGLVGS